jgi:hypothetical protein
VGFLEGVWHALSDVYTVIKVVDGILRFTDGGEAHLDAELL